MRRLFHRVLSTYSGSTANVVALSVLFVLSSCGDAQVAGGEGGAIDDVEISDSIVGDSLGDAALDVLDVAHPHDAVTSDANDTDAAGGDIDALDVELDSGAWKDPETVHKCRIPCAEQEDCRPGFRCELGNCVLDGLIVTCTSDEYCRLTVSRVFGVVDANRPCESSADCPIDGSPWKNTDTCVVFNSGKYCAKTTDGPCLENSTWALYSVPEAGTGETVAICLVEFVCSHPIFPAVDPGDSHHYGPSCIIGCGHGTPVGLDPADPQTTCDPETQQWVCTDESCPGKCIDGYCRCTSDAHCKGPYHPKCVEGVCSCTPTSCAGIDDEGVECVELYFADGRRVVR